MKNKIMMKSALAFLVVLLLAVGFALYSEEAYASSTPTFTSRSEASAYYLQRMKAHASTIEFTYCSSNGDGSQVCKYFNADVFCDNATSTSRLGDYFHYGLYNGYNVTYYYYSYEGLYYYTFTYKMKYKMTLAQDRAFESKLKTVMRSLNLSGRSDYAKVNAIYSYICRYVKYDYYHSSSYYQKYTAYAALCNKKAVCQGYANLFYRMCRYAGVPCRMIIGRSRGQGHAWNIVKIGDYYYNVDPTWDAGETKYSYFLKANRYFTDHSRSSTYATSSFYSAQPMSSTNFYLIKIQRPSVSVRKVSATKVKLTWSRCSSASGYYIYRSANGGSYVKIGTMSSSRTYCYNSNLMDGNRYRYKVIAFRNVNGSKAYSLTSFYASVYI